jgi:hypothetical protein
MKKFKSYLLLSFCGFIGCTATAQLEKIGDIENEDVVYYTIKYDDPTHFTAFATNLCPGDIDISSVNLNIAARSYPNLMISSRLQIAGEYKIAYYDRIEKVYSKYDSEGASYELPEYSFSVYKDKPQTELYFTGAFGAYQWTSTKEKKVNIKSVGRTDYVTYVPLTIARSVGPRIGVGYKSSMYSGTEINGEQINPVGAPILFDQNGPNTTMVEMSYLSIGAQYTVITNSVVSITDYGDRYVRSTVNVYADVLYSYSHEIDDVFARVGVISSPIGGSSQNVYGVYETQNLTPFDKSGFQIGAEWIGYYRVGSVFMRAAYASIPNIKREGSIRMTAGFGFNISNKSAPRADLSN